MIDPAALLTLLQEAAPELTWIPFGDACGTAYHAQNTTVFAGPRWGAASATLVCVWTGPRPRARSYKPTTCPGYNAVELPADPSRIARAVLDAHIRNARDAEDVQRFCARMKAQRDVVIFTNKLENAKAFLEIRRRAFAEQENRVLAEISECTRALAEAEITVRALYQTAREPK